MDETAPDSGPVVARDGGGTATSPRLLAALVRESSDLLGVIARDSGVVYLSPAGMALLTGSEDDSPPVGDPGRLTERIHPDDFPVLVDAVRRSRAEPGQPVAATLRVARGDGTWRHFEGEFVNRMDDPDIGGVVLNFSDVTDRVAAETELRHRLEVETTMSAISRDFIDRGLAALDASIGAALARIGALADVDRVAVYMVSGNAASCTHEWYRDGGEPHIDLMQGIPLDSVPWGMAPLARGKPLVVERLADVAAEATTEQEILESLGIKSFAVVPMAETDRLVGFIGLDSGAEERSWSPWILGMLAQFAPILTAALHRRAADAAKQRVEEEMLRSEERFRRLVQATGDVIVVVDAEGRLTYVSPAVTPMLGYAPEDRLGTSVFDIVHPDDFEGAVVVFARVLTAPGLPGEPLPLRVRHADGSWTDVEVVGTNLFEEPAVGGMVLNVRDMRERRRIEAAMQEAEVRFEQAFEHAPIGMGLASRSGRLLRVNAAFCEMLGYTEEELLSLSFAELSHPDDLEKSRELDKRFFAGDIHEYLIEKRYHHADGHWVWARVSVSLVRAADGEPLYSIGQIEDITERKQFEERLAYEATHDALTGLPLRKLLLDRLELALAGARRHDGHVAALFIDLDRFKRVNDSLGHAAGDELLVIVADRLRAAVREVDTPGRFGGDEFVVVCPDLPDPRDAVVVAERIRELMEKPFLVRGVEVFVGASIGIAVSELDSDGPTLLRRADTAAFRAKERGRNRYEIFDEDLRASVARRVDTEAALRKALEGNELRLAYQPIVEAGSGSIHAFEALVRWERPGRGLLDPAEFLAIAEESGLVVPLGRYVLAEACREAATWDHAAARRAPIVAVNLSPRQLTQPELVEDVSGALGRAGLSPARLCLEITETLLMHDIPQTVATLRELRDLGVQIAIDDFGTGYSSLSHLRRLPITALKIDRSFVHELGVDPQGSTIVASVINLAHALDKEVIAEGVETSEQLETLRGLGCDLMQGFLFSPPVFAVEAGYIAATGLLAPRNDAA